MSGAPAFADWLEIANLKARYCRFLDTKDWDGFAGLFTEGFILDATASGGPRIEGRDAAIASVRTSIEAAKTAHQIHSPEIEVDEDEARAIWAMQDRLLWPGGRTLTGFGHYHERYVREDGVWKIAESRLTRLNLEMTQPSG
ncbi:nuclear transport factor 2 family protein [Sphingomonas cavernae]|uniref:Nuclear transport factor 2 family protein n=1 Tax=Sphingomonas cavernae TaxID=2320861 RepID=A0A418WMF4_9SPHN|nr:nuclear transport factor 2 family protein [Sphingomonas cavernae]RJF91181.1 nuclear transport factor 2 family protein [Sphingomonas cavernae]